MEQRVLTEEVYKKPKKGISSFGGDLVEVIGERTVELPNKEVVEQYFYTIENVESENELPLVGLKANVTIL